MEASRTKYEYCCESYGRGFNHHSSKCKAVHTTFEGQFLRALQIKLGATAVLTVVLIVIPSINSIVKANKITEQHH